ncbi:hypothetical protein JHK85_007643 [Glycine max]|nr:hypothetical protein JHK85_007643 [Glycine max]KAG5072212.1 hypothetical protein JHK86_007423 [Glycine max]
MGSEMQPFVETPPKVVEPNRYSHRSIETLVVVIAVITIAGVITGMIARLSGWVEKKCRSCIDGGLPPPPPPPEEPKPAPAPEGDASHSLLL